MIVKPLNVGKGLQAYRLFAEPSVEEPAGGGAADLTDAEVQRIFYERLMSESEKVAERNAEGAGEAPEH